MFFYAWGEPMWIALLLFTSFFNYGFGMLIERQKQQKTALIFAVIVNLGLLIAFKYSGFLWDNINMLVSLPFPRPVNSLPIGISFYTFQTISYLVDIKRREIKSQRNPLNFLMYISMFPQLVAGPIVRYRLVEDALTNRKVTWDDVSAGVSRFALGLFKKVVIANIAAEMVKRYLDDGFDVLSTGEAWFGIIMFAVQIYFDFSGYSDMAIGLARMFGFKLEENFRHPYAAVSCGDFYRRWHISLGQFYRDYVYIPLGGNRRHHELNIMIVWALTGIWHGASWNFMFWGLYFGVFMVIENRLKKLINMMPMIIKRFYTVFIILFSWSIFYFTDFGQLKAFIINLFCSSHPVGINFVSDLREHAFWFVLILLLCIPWNEIYPKGSHLNTIYSTSYNYLQPVISVVLLLSSTVILVGSTYNPFIYFRF
ncbi:MAG: MBOAT family protein [Tannerella sp.]|nr:MBOAT family protein [Tannerella sp.]